MLLQMMVPMKNMISTIIFDKDDEFDFKDHFDKDDLK